MTYSKTMKTAEVETYKGYTFTCPYCEFVESGRFSDLGSVVEKGSTYQIGFIECLNCGEKLELVWGINEPVY